MGSGWKKESLELKSSGMGVGGEQQKHLWNDGKGEGEEIHQMAPNVVGWREKVFFFFRIPFANLQWQKSFFSSFLAKFPF